MRWQGVFLLRTVRANCLSRLTGDGKSRPLDFQTESNPANVLVRSSGSYFVRKFFLELFTRDRDTRPSAAKAGSIRQKQPSFSVNSNTSSGELVGFCVEGTRDTEPHTTEPRHTCGGKRRAHRRHHLSPPSSSHAASCPHKARSAAPTPPLLRPR
jgi:hypothetical protein